MNIDEAIKLNGEEFLDNILNGNIEDLILINQYIKYQREDGMLLILKAAIMSKIRKLTSSYIFMKEIYFEDKIIELQKKIKSNTITNDENELLEQLKDEKLLFDKDVLKHQKGNKKQLFPNSDFDYYKYFEETKFHFFSEQLLATLKLTDIRINEQKKKNPPLPTPLPKELTPEKKEKLKQYFISSFKGTTNNPNYFENLLIPELNEYVNHIKAKDCARIAAIIYDSKYFKQTKKPTYNKWLNDFYDIMGIKTKTMYKRNVLKNEKKFNELRKKFGYLNI
jgi:hypothetical protein